MTFWQGIKTCPKKIAVTDLYMLHSSRENLNLHTRTQSMSSRWSCLFDRCTYCLFLVFVLCCLFLFFVIACFMLYTCSRSNIYVLFLSGYLSNLFSTWLLIKSPKYLC